MTYNSIEEIEQRLSCLGKTALQNIGRNCGVARFYALRIGELREAILAIAKGEVAPLPVYKRNIRQPRLFRFQEIVDDVLEFPKQIFNYKIKRPSMVALFFPFNNLHLLTRNYLVHPPVK